MRAVLTRPSWPIGSRHRGLGGWRRSHARNETGLPSGEDRDLAVKNRDIIAPKMTAAQIAEAQRLARDWKPKTQAAPTCDFYSRLRQEAPELFEEADLKGHKRFNEVRGQGWGLTPSNRRNKMD